VTTQTIFPTSFPPRLKIEAVFDTREAMEWRVVGGTMSTRAATRSKKDSSTDISDSTDDMDAEDDVRESDDEA